ncbi:hypothetical protein EIP86_003768 [Pleurotus ostreatoroseus]|nr:hypothetical protein EIP86_003768 [Pleurotus ostreatoroseus]
METIETFDALRVALAASGTTGDDFGDLEIQHMLHRDPICTPQLKIIHTTIPDYLEHVPIREELQKDIDVRSSEERTGHIEKEYMFGEGCPHTYQGDTTACSTEIVALAIQDDIRVLSEAPYGGAKSACIIAEDVV